MVVLRYNTDDDICADIEYRLLRYKTHKSKYFML